MCPPLHRHPVTNDYMPEQFREEAFLKSAGDISDKLWDEEALRQWELEENKGISWEGRAAISQTKANSDPNSPYARGQRSFEEF